MLAGFLFAKDCCTTIRTRPLITTCRRSLSFGAMG